MANAQRATSSQDTRTFQFSGKPRKFPSVDAIPFLWPSSALAASELIVEWRERAAVTVSSVAVSGSNTIIVTLSAPPTGTGQMVGMGINGTASDGQPGPTTGPRTNIRDSSADVEVVGGQNLPMYNWACNQKVAVTV